MQNNKSVDIPLMLSLLIETPAKRTFARGMHKILTVGSTLDSDNLLKPRNKIFCTIIHLNRDSACCDYALRCAAICSSNNFTFLLLHCDVICLSMFCLPFNLYNTSCLSFLSFKASPIILFFTFLTKKVLMVKPINATRCGARASPSAFSNELKTFK